ncbi:MAG: Holliday junction resolvase RuvX [Pseudomonadota bacterium]
MPDIIIGLDYSRRKIGVATGQTLTNTASALTTVMNLEAGKINWGKLDEIISQWHPVALVVGLPLDMDGSEQATTKAARQFGKQLEKRYSQTIHFMDERLSSREASHILGYEGITSPRRNSRPGKKVKKNKRTGNDIDSVAAQLILQSWLNEQS